MSNHCADFGMALFTFRRQSWGIHFLILRLMAGNGQVFQKHSPF
jgi:hypothetical protein